MITNQTSSLMHIPGFETDLPAPETIAAPMRDFVSVRVGDADYGIDAGFVYETRAWTAPTALKAPVPPFITGVVDLRGTMVPLLDLRVKLELPDATCDADASIVIVRSRRSMVGLVVDAVNDIVSVRADRILPAPNYGTPIKTSRLGGCLVAMGARVMIVIDLARLLSSEDTALMQLPN